jgi:hypothetical protein
LKLKKSLPSVVCKEIDVRKREESAFLLVTAIVKKNRKTLTTKAERKAD